MLWALALRHLAPPPAAALDVPWFAAVPVFYLAEVHVVHVHFQREAHTISLNEIGLVLGLYLLSPGSLVLAQLLGAGMALAYHRRQRPVKLAFNLAQFALSTSVAVLVYHSISSFGDSYGVSGWSAAIVATITASLLGIVFVTLAISIAQREWVMSQLPATAVVSIVTTIATSCLGLLLIELARIDARSLVLLLVPGAIVIVAFHAFMEQRRRHQHLEFLYESMQRTQSAPEFGLAVGQLLIAVRRLVRAEYAEILLFPTDADHGLRSTLGAGGEMLMQPDDVAPADMLVLALTEQSPQTFLLARNRSEHPLDTYLAARNLPDGMVTVLRTEDGPFGVLVVGDRSDDVDSFTHADQTLLETFAGHASVLLENGRLERSLAEVTELKEQLHQQAFYDTITGLPNRALFLERVEEAMDRVDDDLSAALLFLDLDDFKAINDSRGHAAGDELLAEVAKRIQGCLRPGDTPARIGGDEFGVLLELGTGENAERVAERLLEALARPIGLGGRETYIRGSIGIAFASSARSADELLRNADVAMYSAKRGGKNRGQVYSSAMHAHFRKRNEVALDLEHAVERGEIDVLFQPIVLLESGQVVAFEALVRWNHRTDGVIMPTDFVPVAEAIGLMPTIGQFVLQTACKAARTWQDEHPAHGDVGVTVNVSPSELLNDQLGAQVARTLLESRLDSACLTLEITESAAMGEASIVHARMHELRALGVKLALDDFGTGHSSLERLDTLPLDMLKIAKPFVDRLLDSTADTGFVDTFVHLAQSLGMECVAEGVAHETQVPLLIERGCSLGQGFYYAQPMRATVLNDYLHSVQLAGFAA